jgi:hypothetical protein
LQNNSNLIGLEHTQLYPKNKKRYLKLVSLIDIAESIYKNSTEFLLASIEMKNDRLDYNRNEKIFS